jgi:hypothetical protein
MAVVVQYKIDTLTLENGGEITTAQTQEKRVMTEDDSIRAIKDTMLIEFLDNIPKIMTEMLIDEFMLEHAYQGFNRNLIRKKAMVKLGSEAIVKIAGLVAMKGTSNKAIGGIKVPIRVTKPNGDLGPAVFTEIREALEMSATRGNNASMLTPGRICAAFPDLAVICMKLGNVQKKLDSDLPAYLQFPAAGSLPMSKNLRALHRDFCVLFSSKINKTGENKFSDDIYESMKMNSGFTSDAIETEFRRVLKDEDMFLVEYYEEGVADGLQVAEV